MRHFDIRFLSLTRFLYFVMCIEIDRGGCVMKVKVQRNARKERWGATVLFVKSLSEIEGFDISDAILADNKIFDMPEKPEYGLSRYPCFFDGVRDVAVTILEGKCFLKPDDEKPFLNVYWNGRGHATTYFYF